MVKKLCFFYVSVLCLCSYSFGVVPSLLELCGRVLILDHDLSDESKQYFNNFIQNNHISPKAFEFKDLKIKNRDYSNLCLNKMKFICCEFIDINFRNTNLIDTDFEGSTFEDVQLEGAFLCDDFRFGDDSIVKKSSICKSSICKSDYLHSLDQRIRSNELSPYTVILQYSKLIYLANALEKQEKINEAKKIKYRHSHKKVKACKKFFSSLKLALKSLKSKQIIDSTKIKESEKFFKKAEALNRIIGLFKFNLRNYNLSYLNLEGINLRNSNLCNTSLCSTNLSSAYLTNVNLEDSILNGARLININLVNVNLKNARLFLIRLSEAQLLLSYERDDFLIEFYNKLTDQEAKKILKQILISKGINIEAVDHH